MKRLLLPLLLLASGAEAQQAPPITVAIPPLTSPDSGTRGNEMLAVGWNATQVIAADLGQTTELSPLKPNHDDYYAYPEVTAPTFSKWRSAGRKGAGHGLRPVSRRRPPDLRLLRLRRRQGPRACPQGLRHYAGRMAPRRAQMLRCGIRRADRRSGHLRYPHRLCRRKRRGRSAGQARRGDGQRRAKPSPGHAGKRDRALAKVRAARSAAWPM